MSSSHDTGKGVEQSSMARERECKVQSSQESEDRLRRENDRETQAPPQVEVCTYRDVPTVVGGGRAYE